MLWDFKWTLLSNYFTPSPAAVGRFEFRIQPQHLPSKFSKLPKTGAALIKVGKVEHEVCSLSHSWRRMGNIPKTLLGIRRDVDFFKMTSDVQIYTKLILHCLLKS